MYMRLVFLLLVVIIVVISPLERVVVVVLLSLASFLKALINFLLFILPVSSFFTTFSIAFVLGFRCTIDVKSAFPVVESSSTSLSMLFCAVANFYLLFHIRVAYISQNVLLCSLHGLQVSHFVFEF